MAFSTKGRLVLAEIESTVGTDASPNTAANALRTTTASPGLNLETIDINENTGSLDENEQAPNGGRMLPRIECVLRGSGVAGTAPDFGVLLQSCAMLETLNASDIAGTASAGTASTITCEPADISADDAHIGGIIELTAGTGYSSSNPKQNRRVITDSVGSSGLVTVYPDFAVTPDATTEYIIRKSAIYRPVSTGVKSSTLYMYERESGGGDARLFKSFGTRGTFALNLPVRGPGSLAFTMAGALQEPADASDPGDGTLQSSSPISWLDAQTYIAGAEICMNSFSLDYGGNVVARQCQNEPYGYEAAEVQARRIQGTITPDAVSIATRNVFTSWRDRTVAKFWTSYGGALGNRISIYIPALVYGAQESIEIDGFIHDSLNFAATGNNAGVYITAW